jgi:D-cysteine desulfhydrase/L-cysteate sulfo-lyase
MTMTTSVSDLFPDLAVAAPRMTYRAPSPLETNPEAAADLGIELLVKREGLLDDFGCGQKARKLGYVLADALAEGANVLVSPASLPSGQAVALSVHGRAAGLRAHIVYCGEEQTRPAVARGYYLLNALLGTTVTWHERGTWASWPEFVDAAMAREGAAGERPYLVPPSMSAWPGLLGSIDLGLELAAQMPDDDRAVSVVAPAGSGGTCLGLAIAARALSRPWTIYGVCFGGPSAATTTSLVGLRRDVADRLGGAVDAPVVLHDASGAGYDRPQPAELDVMRLCLSRYRLPVDPTYMAKTVIGLQELIGSGAIAAGSRVVLVHTGGNLGVFNDSAAVEAWASDALAHYLR